MKYILAILILVSFIFSLAPQALAAQETQKPQSSDPYIWGPFVTWLVDTANWIFTFKYQPAYEQPLPGSQKIRRVDAYNHGNNEWFW